MCKFLPYDQNQTMPVSSFGAKRRATGKNVQRTYTGIACVHINEKWKSSSDNKLKMEKS